jgi:hypothetical protein
LVVLATVAKKLVVVAFVLVEFRAVKSRRVVEPERSRFESEVRPPVAVRVVPTVSDPVRLAVADMVCPLIAPEVMVFDPRLSAPVDVIAPSDEAPPVSEKKLADEAKRFVEDAVVEKKFVVVALVVVELPVITRLPFTVDEAFERKPPDRTESPVVVENVVVEFCVVSEAMVEEAEIMIPRVVVGARYLGEPTIEKSLNCEAK